MAQIRLSPFGGMRPAIASTLRDIRYADFAIDASLRDGSLKPQRAPRLICEGDYQSIFCCPLTQDSKKCGIEPREECAYSFVDDPNCSNGFDTTVVFYHRIENKKPERIVHETCEVCPLCLEAPEGEDFTAEILNTGIVAQIDTRIYTYTWVDKFGIESPPAMVSNELCLEDDGEVRLSNFATPPAGAACIRIYRTSSPFMDGDDETATFDTTFQLVEEIDLTGGTPWPGFYIDDKCLAEICLGTLQTMANCCPPEICGIVRTESGYYVAWADNQIWVSERHNPSNFPLVNMLELPDRIVNIVAHRDTVLVGTTGSPYRVSIAAQQNGDVIEAESFRDKLPLVQPDSMVETPWGAVYATDIGLVGLTPTGSPRVLSRERITEDDWREYLPEVGAWYRGRYYGFKKDGHGIVFDLAEGGESRLEIGDFVLTSFNAEYAKVNDDGNMYLINDGDVYHWDNGDDVLPYTWKSKQIEVLPRSNASVLYISGKGKVSVRIWADGCPVFECEDMEIRCKPWRLPRLKKACDWQVELRGVACLDRVVLASSMSEIS